MGHKQKHDAVGAEQLPALCFYVSRWKLTRAMDGDGANWGIMSFNDTKFSGVPVEYRSIGLVRCLAVLILPLLLLTGCSTVVTYQPNAPTGPAKPVGYPIPLYTRTMTVPRPCVLIGTVTIGGGTFTMRGGSVEAETKKIMQMAWEKGADAIQITSVRKPSLSRADFTLVADLLRYADTWDSIPISDQWFNDYLNVNRRNLDPIEGVWEGYEIGPVRIGIMRNTSRPGRDFIGFILKAQNPVWREGYKKIDIRRGAEPGSYIFDYYLDNFSRRETTVILGNKTTFSLMMPTSEDAPSFITYTKIR